MTEEMPKKNLGGRPRIWTDEKIQEEADYLVEWASKPDSLVLGQCYGMRGYSYHEAMDWPKIHPGYCQAKKRAMAIIGARREAGAITNKYNEKIILKSMPLYDPEYKALVDEERLAQANSSTDALFIKEVAKVIAEKDKERERKS